ncbi:MAG: FecR family protein [Bacteroidales bacterium]
MKIDRKHIDRIFSGEFGLKDHKKLEEYFLSIGMEGGVKQIIEEQWRNFEQDESSETSLEHVFYRILLDIQSSEVKTGNRFANYFKRIAVVFIIILLFGGAFYWGRISSSDMRLATFEIHSPKGMRSSFKLPDGTHGWLGYSSHLRYEEEGKKRIVHLDGRAYFDVWHSKDSTFVVSSPLGYSICVLGTNFNVNSYSEENNFEVVLEKGSISIENRGQLVDRLRPNEKISYDKESGELIKSVVTSSHYTEWKDGKLSIDNEPFEQACKKIGVFYNVEFEDIPDALKSKNVRMVLQNEPLDEALHIIALLYPVRYTITDRVKLESGSYSKRKVILRMK